MSHAIVSHAPLVPYFAETGTTAERILAAAACYRRRFHAEPAKVVIYAPADDGSRPAGIVVEVVPLTGSTPDMLFAFGPEERP